MIKFAWMSGDILLQSVHKHYAWNGQGTTTLVIQVCLEFKKTFDPVGSQKEIEEARVEHTMDYGTVYIVLL